jgi:PAS domain S-box-containing protein
METATTSFTQSSVQTAIVRNPLIVSPEITVREAIAQMHQIRQTHADPHLEARSSCVLVAEGDRLTGIFTEREVVSLIARQLSLETLMREVMISPVISLRESAFTHIYAAVHRLQQQQIRYLPLLDDQDRVVGLLTLESLLLKAYPAEQITHSENVGEMGAITDISDRKQAEQELIRSRDLHEAIFNESTDAVFLVDPQTLLILDCNRRAVRLFGAADKAELIGVAGHTLQRHQFSESELAAIVAEMQAKGFWSREIEYVTRQGDFFWGNIAAKPIMVAGCTMNLIRVTNISDRKQSDVKLQRTTAQLEASNKELEAFAYSVSHDLRSPLRAIDGFSKALLEDYGDQLGAEGKDYFDRIRHNVGRMGMLIDDLLRLSRVSRSEMQYSVVNLSTLVQDHLHELQVAEPERQVARVIAPEAIVLADLALMRVVISNLLQNAWKFTSHHATARIEFGVVQREGQLIYFVQDDGAGFDMVYAKMLFGVFQRLHNTNEFPGTGIGLATVQRIIHRHGGQIWAEAAVEQGATLYFTLPHLPLQAGA